MATQRRRTESPHYLLLTSRYLKNSWFQTECGLISRLTVFTYLLTLLTHYETLNLSYYSEVFIS